MAINAGLLQIGDLGNQLRNNRLEAQQNQENMLKSATQFANIYQSGTNDEALNKALANNFDKATGKLNQDGVVSELYAYSPKFAQEVGQNYAMQNQKNKKFDMDLNKTQAETLKLGSESNKINYEADNFKLKTQLEKNQTMMQLINSIDPSNPNTFTKAIEFGKSQGYDSSLFNSINPNDPKQLAGAKKQAMGYLIQANDEVKNVISQQNADTQRMGVGINQQNADSSTMNALTNQQRANQDYEINTNKNDIDMYKTSLDDKKIQNEIEKNGQLNPSQQLDYQKATNDLNFKKIDESNKIREKVSSLEYTNNLLNTFSGNASRLLDNPLFTKGKNPETGDYLRDSSNKIIPADSNQGGLWGMANRKWVPGTNEYKEAQQEYDTLVGIAKGKTQAEFKTSIGSTGPVTDADAKNFAAMQKLPENFESFVKLNPQQQIDALEDIRQTSLSSIAHNNNNIKKYISQGDLISKQQITEPVLKGKVFEAPNGYKLTPKMFQKIKELEERGEL